MGNQPTPWSRHRPAFGAENRATQTRLGDAAVVALASSPAFQNGHYLLCRCQGYSAGPQLGGRAGRPDPGPRPATAARPPAPKLAP